MVATQTIILLSIYLISLYFNIFLFLTFVDNIFLNNKSNITNLKNQNYKKTKEDFHPTVSILVPAFNEEKTIEKTLESIYNLNYPKNKLDVIIIDDGSTDNTKQIAIDFIKKHNAYNFFRILTHLNQGKAASLNKALEYVISDFFACLDADSFVDEETLNKMLDLYNKENDKNIAIITPAMKVHKPKTFLQRIQWLEYLIMMFLSKIISSINCIYVAPGPFSIYKTDIIKKMGKFDINTVAEDQEIAYRAQKHHYKIKHCHIGYVHTTAPEKVYPFYKQRRRWYIGSMQCAYKYKSIIGNLKYGDFGLLQMTLNIFGFIFGITAILLGFKFLIFPLFKSISNAFIVGFDFMPFIKTWKLTFKHLFVNVSIMVPFIFLLLLSSFFFIQSHYNAKEKLFKFGFIELIPYFFFYFLLVGGILLISLFEFTFSKKHKW